MSERRYAPTDMLRSTDAECYSWVLEVGRGIHPMRVSILDYSLLERLGQLHIHLVEVVSQLVTSFHLQFERFFVVHRIHFSERATRPVNSWGRKITPRSDARPRIGRFLNFQGAILHACGIAIG